MCLPAQAAHLGIHGHDAVPDRRQGLLAAGAPCRSMQLCAAMSRKSSVPLRKAYQSTL